MEKLVILTGPTAVGKTNLSIKLAKAINGEIISADCMQVYKYMDIGTAKVMPEEMEGVRHYLIDVIDPSVDFNVVKFKEMATDAIKEITAKGKIPIICGGTGFYIQALLYDIDFTPMEIDECLREKYEKFADENGNEALWRQLKEVDEDSALSIPFNNRKRVIRALEYFNSTGQKFSVHNKEQHLKNSPYNFAYFVLNDNRDVLYNRIDKRVDIMANNGLVEEVKNLKEMGYHRGQTSMDGIGYKEILQYLDGEISLEEAIDSVKQGSRHYAKRQLTWFRRERDVIWLNKENTSDEALLEEMKDILKEKGII